MICCFALGYTFGMTQLLLNLPDDVVESLRERARREGSSVETIVADAAKIAAARQPTTLEDLRKLLDESGAEPLGGPFRREDAYQGRRFQD